MKNKRLNPNENIMNNETAYILSHEMSSEIHESAGADVYERVFREILEVQEVYGPPPMESDEDISVFYKDIFEETIPPVKSDEGISTQEADVFEETLPRDFPIKRRSHITKE